GSGHEPTGLVAVEPDRQVLAPPGGGAPPGRGDGGVRPRSELAPEQPVQHRTPEDLEGDRGAHRVAGKGEHEGAAASTAPPLGLSRLRPHVTKAPRAELLEGDPGDDEGTDADPAGEEDQVAVGKLVQGGAEGRDVVRDGRDVA